MLPGVGRDEVSDLIPRGDRIMALLSPPSQDLHLTVDDARWIKGEIAELHSYLSEEREKNEKQVRMTMEALAKLECDDD